MSESLKSILGVVVAAGVLAGILSWFPGATNEVSTVRWWGRAGGPVLALLCLVPLVWAQTRKDKAPDLLLRIAPRYFERDGFCFAIVPRITGGHCAMNIYFQNRYDRPCSAQVLIRATSSLFAGPPDLAEIALGVACGPAEFGCSTIPWPVPQEMQGRKASLSLYAGVKYPAGRGTLLRYRDGLRVGAVGTDFWREGLQVAGALGGALVVSRPATLKLPLPSGVAASCAGPLEARTKIIWKPGDPVP